MNKIRMIAMPISIIMLIVGFALLTVADSHQKIDLTAFYNKWFESPYEYMFEEYPEEDSLRVGNGSYTTFMAGMSGLLYYGGLNECASFILGEESSNMWGDASAFGRLAGLPITNQRIPNGAPFQFINPDIVEWGHNNLIPEIDTIIGGQPAQTIYSAIFSRFFRMMAESYLWLEANDLFEKEMIEYWNAILEADDNFYGTDYLQDRYENWILQKGGRLAEYHVEQDYTSLTPSMAVGFWLRRGLDGTHDELWLGLKKVLLRFDARWYTRLKVAYRSAAIRW